MRPSYDKDWFTGASELRSRGRNLAPCRKLNGHDGLWKARLALVFFFFRSLRWRSISNFFGGFGTNRLVLSVHVVLCNATEQGISRGYGATYCSSEIVRVISGWTEAKLDDPP
ncbi:uncharacterized protein CTRU02_205280 [Colletotrichum truncatum]|uniref:Uncharacterized protein n=1 Tax=Colletotrichum truncatum TaxID=5467 RepID=A0ACC3Z3W0_COLTU